MKTQQAAAPLRATSGAKVRRDVEHKIHKEYSMTTQNYQTNVPAQQIEKVASGQKMIILAILLNFLTIGLQIAIGDIAGLLGIVALIISLVGLFRLATGLGYSTGAKIGFVILLLIPLIGLITLLILNSKATAALRAAGYKVGLLGAAK